MNSKNESVLKIGSKSYYNFFIKWYKKTGKEKYLKEILTNPYDTEIVRKDLPSDIPDKKDNSTLTDEEALLAFKRKYKFLFSYIHRPLFRVKRALSGLLFFKFRKKLCIQNQLLQLDNARKDCQNLQIGFQETIIDEIDCLENRIKGIKVSCDNNNTNHSLVFNLFMHFTACLVQAVFSI